MIPAIAIPALIALVVKFGLLCYSLTLAAKTYAMRVVIALLFVFTLHNLVEFLGLSIWSGEVTWAMERLGFAYIALLIPTVALILHASLLLSYERASDDKRFRLQPLLYVPGVLLLYLLLGTDQLVTGFQPFKNTLFRVAGPWYILFEAYAIAYLSAAFFILILGTRGSHRSAVGRARNRLWLLGLMLPGLLLLYLITANHYGVAKLSSTIYLPIPLTLFLLIAAYATHRRRVIDVGFFIPGSTVRKRKTKFYEHVQKLIDGISDTLHVQHLLRNMARAFGCDVVLIGGPRPLVARKNDEKDPSVRENELMQFPYKALQHVDTFVVADEVAHSRPALHSLMKRHRVDAIVPFRSDYVTSPHWLLFGEGFNDEVYTPRDFKIVAPLFDRIAEYFLQSSKLMRSQLGDAMEDIRGLRERLALAWDELAKLRADAVAAGAENRRLWVEKAALLRRRFLGTEERVPQSIASGDDTLEEYLAETERQIVVAALEHSEGNELKAARLLGISIRKLNRIVNRRPGGPLD